MGKMLRSNNKKCFECGCVLDYDPDNNRYVCPDRKCGAIYDYSEYRAMMDIGKRPEPLNKKEPPPQKPPEVKPEPVAKKCPVCDREMNFAGKICPACYPIFVRCKRNMSKARKYRKAHPVRIRGTADQVVPGKSALGKRIESAILLENLGVRLVFEIAVMNLRMEKIKK